MRTAIVSKDFVTLPTALMAEFKPWARANDFNDDDTLLLSMLRQAIDMFETKNEHSVFKTELALSPDAADFCSGRLRLPPPVLSFAATVLDGANPPVDVSAAYQLIVSGITGAFKLYELGGAFAYGLSLAVVAGYDGIVGGANVKAPLPPQAQNAILRLASNFYEYRDVMTTTTVAIPDEWRNDLLGGNWSPRC